MKLNSNQNLLDRFRHLLTSSPVKDQRLLYVFFLSFALRVIYMQGWLYWIPTPQTPVFGDALDYYSRPFAPKLLLGRGPVYSLFLAGVFTIFGRDPWPVRYIQCCLDIATCIFIYLLAREITNRRVAWIAGLLAALHPSLILFTGRILTETLCLFLFWLGLLLFVKRKSLALTGVVLSIACLTRPTLLATVPFLIASLIFSLEEKWSQRLKRLIPFGLGLLLPIFLWNAIAYFSGYSPPAGASGLGYFLNIMQSSTDPSFRGWYPDVPWDRSAGNPNWWKTIFWQNPLSLPVTALNLIFYHLWFLDNLWNELPNVFHWIPRFLLFFSLGGLSISLWQKRKLLPILVLLIPFLLICIKWIEVRHTLPFLPLLFVLTGIFLSALIDWLALGKRKWIAAISLLGTIVMIYCTRFFMLASLFPGVSPLIIGYSGDAMIVLAALYWGCFITWLTHSSGYALRKAFVTGFSPSIIFVFLFASYVAEGSEPRWRSWTINVTEPVHQSISITKPIDARQIAAAMWVVDLQTSTTMPSLTALANGQTQLYWEPLFCSLANQSRWSESEWTYCQPVYRNGYAPVIGELETWPQWWGLPVSSSEIADRTTVSLTIMSTNPQVTNRIGGVVGDPSFGPSVNALSVGMRTSVYRWRVTGDWRLWEKNNLSSSNTKGSLGSDRMFQQTTASWNIRLLVVFKDGRREVY